MTLIDIATKLDDCARKLENAARIVEHRDRVLQHAALLLDVALDAQYTHAQKNGAMKLVKAYLERFVGTKNTYLQPPTDISDIPF